MVSKFGFFLSFYLCSTINVSVFSQTLPSSQEFHSLITGCALGLKVDASADLIGSLATFYEGKRSQGKVQLNVFTDFLNSFPEKDRVVAYELYVNCIKAIIEKYDSSASLNTPTTGKERLLDNGVHKLNGQRYWTFHDKATSINGKFMDYYGEMSPGPQSEASVSFDIRGWELFEGWAGIISNDKRSNTLIIQVDEKIVASHQLRFGKKPVALRIPLNGAQTLTFKRPGRYPLIVIGEPTLSKESE